MACFFFAHALADLPKEIPPLRSGAIDPREPVYVVEVGAGHGKLSLLMLRQLSEMGDRLPAGVRLRYVMTDFTLSNVSKWSDNPKLQPFVRDGLLTFAAFDAERHSRVVTSSGEAVSGNPCIVIANYVFDTLRHDAYRLSVAHESPEEAATLEETLCTVSLPPSLAVPAAAAIASHTLPDAALEGAGEDPTAEHPALHTDLAAPYPKHQNHQSSE